MSENNSEIEEMRFGFKKKKTKGKEDRPRAFCLRSYRARHFPSEIPREVSRFGKIAKLCVTAAPLPRILQKVPHTVERL